MADRYIRTLFSDFSKGLDLVDHNVLNLSAKKGYDITRATLAKKKSNGKQVGKGQITTIKRL